MLLKNINTMNDTSPNAIGMDIIIVSTSNSTQEDYWQKHLESKRGNGLKENALILCITEEWPGGAGNGLGTLFVYQEARKKAQLQYGIDLLSKQQEGASVAIYHTAGQGKRLAPLTISENNNKPAVKLPGYWRAHDDQLMSVLEAVIKQTALSSFKGRLGVFWGDQIFIPSIDLTQHLPDHHIEILSIPLTSPSKKLWKERDLDKYGIIARNASGQALQIDKVEYRTIEDLVENKIISSTFPISISLGSFNLSAQILSALLEEFQVELSLKRGKLDTDPHFWMPLTLNSATYQELMERRNVSKAESLKHYSRMQQFLKKFEFNQTECKLFNNTNIGTDSLWWDYGTYQAYFKNNMKLTSSNEEGKLLREFFSVPEKLKSTSNQHLDCDKDSVIIDCDIKEGKIRNSILIGVKTKVVNASNSLVLNSTTNELHIRDSLFYNVIEATNEHYEHYDKTVRADAIQNEVNVSFCTSMERDSKDDWDIVLPRNTISYAEASKKGT